MAHGEVVQSVESFFVEKDEVLGLIAELAAATRAATAARKGAAFFEGGNIADEYAGGDANTNDSRPNKM